MICSDQFQHPQQLYDFVHDHISDYNFIFYDNDSDSKELRTVKANPIPTDFKYTIKAPEKKQDAPQRSKLFGAGYGVPMNVTYFNSDGHPYKMNNSGGMRPS